MNVEPLGPSDEVVYERRADAAWLRLNRPDALNALTPRIIAALHEGMDRASADRGVRSLVVTGTGRALCAGADLTFGSGDEGYERVTGFLDDVGAALSRLEAFPMPTIAAVNGVALGGGFEIVLVCDLVVCARSARLGDSHAKYGFVPGGGASARLPRRIGLNHTKYLMYTAALLPPDDRRLSELVTDVVDDDRLIDEVDAVAAVIAERSPLGLARMKQLVGDAADQSLATALRQELLVSALHRRSYDNTEGSNAFAEKRKPRFEGR